ncbi:DUF2125 domain-containing protein [Zavarzinia sp. CC-PAN008]|uniref:DUF2125 domain-containing protein n=1 Tax=Zavarzinia sp. CC-PAN008 TaxID=3243332 RepID=UPI003F746DC1
MRYLGLGLAVALLAAAWSGVWFYLAGQMPHWIDAWAQDERSRGTEVSWSALRVEGYPFRLVVVIDNPRMARPDGSWSGTRLTGYAQPWNLNHWILGFEGTHSLSDGQRTLGVSGGPLMASMRFAEGRLARLDVDLKAPVLTPSWLPGPITAERIEFHGMTDDGQPLAIAARAQALTLPDGVVQGLPPRIDAADLVGTLRGAAIPAPTRPHLAAWSRSGGVVEVTQAGLKAGSLDLVADGTFALDDLLRPQGAGVVRAAGLDAVIDSLVSQGRVAPQAGQAVKGALAIAGLAARDEAGRTQIPFAIQDGTLSVGPAPVAQVQPVL